MKNNIKIILGMFVLILSMLTFTTAVECSGQNCPVNMNLNVTDGTIIVVTPQYSVTGQAIFDVLSSSGAGIGTLFGFIGSSLPILLIGIVLVALIVAIAYSIFKSVGLWKHATDNH